MPALALLTNQSSSTLYRILSSVPTPKGNPDFHQRGIATSCAAVAPPAKLPLAGSWSRMMLPSIGPDSVVVGPGQARHYPPRTEPVDRHCAHSSLWQDESAVGSAVGRVVGRAGSSGRRKIAGSWTRASDANRNCIDSDLTSHPGSGWTRTHPSHVCRPGCTRRAMRARTGILKT